MVSNIKKIIKLSKRFESLKPKFLDEANYKGALLLNLPFLGRVLKPITKLNS